MIFVVCHFYYKLGEVPTETNIGSDVKPEISSTITGTTDITLAGEHLETGEFKLIG